MLRRCPRIWTGCRRSWRWSATRRWAKTSEERHRCRPHRWRLSVPRTDPRGYRRMLSGRISRSGDDRPCPRPHSPPRRPGPPIPVGRKRRDLTVVPLGHPEAASQFPIHSPIVVAVVPSLHSPQETSYFRSVLDAGSVREIDFRSRYPVGRVGRTKIYACRQQAYNTAVSQRVRIMWDARHRDRSVASPIVHAIILPNSDWAANRFPSGAFV